MRGSNTPATGIPSRRRGIASNDISGGKPAGTRSRAACDFTASLHGFSVCASHRHDARRADRGRRSKAIRDFVNDGGVLLIDPCGGSRRFNESVRKNWLPAIFPDSIPRVMGDDDPIITGKVAAQLTKAADDLSKVAVRRYTAQVAKPTNTRLLEFTYGKGRVIISELDLTHGSCSAPKAWGISGYAPGYAQSLVKNILLWAASR